MNNFQQKRFDNIISDMSKGLAFFDGVGNMWLYDFNTDSENFIYNQNEEYINYEKFVTIVIDYIKFGGKVYGNIENP